MQNWRADPDDFLLIFKAAGRAKKSGRNGWVIGVPIETVFGSFFDRVTRPKNWVKMGEFMGLVLSLIGPSDALFLDIHSTSISEWFRGEFFGGFGLKIGSCKASIRAFLISFN